MLLPNLCFAVTEFTSVINKAATEDYNTLTLWEAAMDDAGDITDGTVKCGNWDNKTGSIPADATAVDWDGGASTGTLIHASESNGGSGGDQYLIDVTGGSLADNDVILDVATSTDGFTIAGTPDSCILTAECYDDDGALTDGDMSINGLTTNTTSYMKITVPEGERHNGILSDGSSGNGFRLNTPNAQSGPRNLDLSSIIEWAQIKVNAVTNNDRWGIQDFYIARNNIVVGHTTNGTNGIQYVSSSLDGVGYILNNIIYDFGQGDNYCIYTNFETVYVENNTCFNSAGRGIYIHGNSGSVGFWYNNISMGNTSSDFEKGGSQPLTKTNNASEDATATGTNSLNSGSGTPPTTADFVSVTGGSEDLHLASGAVEIDAGTNLGTTSGVNFDIDGRDRDAEGDVWDIGADEFVAAAPTGGNIPIEGINLHGININL